MVNSFGSFAGKNTEPSFVYGIGQVMSGIAWLVDNTRMWVNGN